jgi:hypothetical protein
VHVHEEFERLTVPYWRLIGKVNQQLCHLFSDARKLMAASCVHDNVNDFDATCEEKNNNVWNPRSRRRRALIPCPIRPVDFEWQDRVALVSEQIQLWRKVCFTLAVACAVPSQ